MLDPKLIRNELGVVAKRLKVKNFELNVEQLKGDIPKRWNKSNVKLELENEEELQLFKKALEASSEVKINRVASSSNYYSTQKDEITLSNSDLFKHCVDSGVSLVRMHLTN